MVHYTLQMQTLANSIARQGWTCPGHEFGLVQQARLEKRLALLADLQLGQD